MGWIYLLIAVFCSSLLTIIFKYFQKYKIHTSSAIVFNYFAASSLAFGFAHHSPSLSTYLSSNWAIPAVILGILFITLFNVLAFASQNIGVAEANIANKTTFIFPALVGMIYFGELVNGAKIIGVLMAVAAIYYSAKDKQQGEIHAGKAAGLIATLFVGGGMLDLLLSFTTEYWVEEHQVGLFTGYGFLMAAIFGTFNWLLQFFKGTAVLQRKDIVGGLLLGIPNYFSIYFFLLALKSTDLESSVVFPVINMGTIIFASLFSWLLFEKRIKRNKFLAISLAILAIVLISWSDHFAF